MGTQYQHVFTTTAVILFAPPIEGKYPTDFSAFDHLLSKIRKEDPETRAANMIRARFLARKAQRKANETLDAKRREMGLL